MRAIPHRAACLAAVLSVSLSAQETTVFEAARVVVAPDTVLEGDGARIAVRAGVVVGVGEEISSDVLQRARRVRFDGATIAPGFVVAHDYLDLGSDLGESIDAFTPALAAADAFDPFDESLERFARGGVTTIGLAPASENTFGGLGAVVQWRTDGGEVLVDTTYLKLAIVRESLDQNRYPTSRMGAADLIRREFAVTQDPLAARDAARTTLANALSGARQVAIHARSLAELTEAIDLSVELGLRPILLSAEDATGCLDAIKRLGASVVLSTLDYDDTLERLALPGKLEEHGIPFSFAAPTPLALRRSAALAVRHGASRRAVTAALTREAARQLGVEDSVGTLRRDRRADFAVYSAHPIDLNARLQAVFVAGERIEGKS